MKLIDVYASPEAARVLYELLAERNPEQNISHKAMPSFDEHCAFVASKPYQAWYLIVDDTDVASAPKVESVPAFPFPPGPPPPAPPVPPPPTVIVYPVPGVGPTTYGELAAPPPPQPPAVLV